MLVTIRTLYVQLLTALLLVATSCTDTTVQNQPSLTSRTTTGQSQPALTLTIVPTSYPNSVFPEPIISLYKPFHVLLTNNSSAPVNIFEEWNSWGYFGLSFEITYSGGRKVRLMKTDPGWQHNFPSTTTIAPHGFYVFDVDFSKDWNNSIRAKPRSQEGIQCRIQAIYSIFQKHPDMNVIGESLVWNGTVCSEEKAYTVYP